MSGAMFAAAACIVAGAALIRLRKGRGRKTGPGGAPSAVAAADAASGGVGGVDVFELPVSADGGPDYMSYMVGKKLAALEESGKRPEGIQFVGAGGDRIMVFLVWGHGGVDDGRDDGRTGTE